MHNVRFPCVGCARADGMSRAGQAEGCQAAASIGAQNELTAKNERTSMWAGPGELRKHTMMSERECSRPIQLRVPDANPRVLASHMALLAQSCLSLQ